MSSDVVIRAEGIGKRYASAHRTADGPISSRIAAHLKEFLPFMQMSADDHFWALKDVDFEVRRGEILGIVGRNGSGKSTLLKILAGVTLPTAGRVAIKGQVGSLLEVGTGFHPDMTGRENVYFSGALLGIERNEIRAKFDEIVDFSGLEEFIDMPVKRYSSGMYVRLAFSVASMLRADILILDEVMAVGDAAFREKSQGVIERSAREGQSILFVSHNTKAVTSLCQTGLVLEKGECIFRGDAKSAVQCYLQSLYHLDFGNPTDSDAFHDLSRKPRLYPPVREVLCWMSTHSEDGTASAEFVTGQAARFRIGFRGARERNSYMSVLIHNGFGDRVATLSSTHPDSRPVMQGDGYVECRVDDLRLGEGLYHIMVDYGTCVEGRSDFISMDCVANAGTIRVSLDGYVKGTGLDAYQGAAHRSEWKAIAEAGSIAAEASRAV